MPPSQTNKADPKNSGPMTASQRMEGRPTTFLFIDSSNGGVNAKPDKIVRSFVMKSARSKKSWSTKPNNSTLQAGTKQSSRRSSTSQTRPGKKSARTNSCSAQQECTNSLTSCSQPIDSSLVSSRRNNVASIHRNSRLYGSPAVDDANPRADYDRTLKIYNTGHERPVTYGLGTNDINLVASFECLAIRLDARTEGLLHQFVTSTAPYLLPLDVHKSSRVAATQWMSTCIQSSIGASFIYAALTTSMRAMKLEYDLCKWRAVSAVNQSLTHHKNSIDDTTIAAVLILLAFEESELADTRKKGDDRRHSMSMNDAHLDGLRKMIEQRGGLAALGGNRCLQTFILMHSIAQSIARFKRPYVVLYNGNGQIDDYAVLSTQPPPTVHGIMQPFHSLGMTPPLLDVIGSVTMFILDLTIWYNTGVCSVDALELQKHASLLKYRLFDWYVQSPQDGSHATDQSVCLALLLFMTHATEPSAPSFGLRLWKVTRKLRSSLRESSPSHWSGVPNLLVWTLTMGALSAKGLSQTSRSSSANSLVHFFTQRLALACAMLNLDTVTPACILKRLRVCLWIPLLFDEPVTRLWEAMRLHTVDVLHLDETSTSGDEDRDQFIDNEYALGQSTTTRFFSRHTQKDRRGN